MRLYAGRIPIIAEDVLQALVDEGHVEVDEEDRPEALLDVIACLREYIRTEREIEDKARDALRRRGMDQTGFGRIKRQFAERMEFGLGDDAIGWIANQILNMLMHSLHFEEVYSEDHQMRRTIAQILKKHLSEDEEVDREVRRKIKNLEEGSMAWDVEYKKVLSQIQRTRKLL